MVARVTAISVACTVFLGLLALWNALRVHAIIGVIHAERAASGRRVSKARGCVDALISFHYRATPRAEHIRKLAHAWIEDPSDDPIRWEAPK